MWRAAVDSTGDCTGNTFTRQNARYSACLVVADQGADSFQEEQIKIAAAQGKTPAQALQYAEDSLSGDAYYGLLDLLALPANSNWQEACSIGSLLYKNVQPAPEISVFALSPEPIQSWAKQGPTLYQNLKALEKRMVFIAGYSSCLRRKTAPQFPVTQPKADMIFFFWEKTPLPFAVKV